MTAPTIRTLSKPFSGDSHYFYQNKGGVMLAISSRILTLNTLGTWVVHIKVRLKKPLKITSGQIGGLNK